MTNPEEKIKELEIKLEAFERFAKAHEEWEADMILDSKVWSNTPNGLPVIWEEYYERWVEGPESLQALRNKALGKES